MTEDERTPADEPTEATVEDDGPDVTELEDDPAYNPQSEELKDLKGG